MKRTAPDRTITTDLAADPGRGLSLTRWAVNMTRVFIALILLSVSAQASTNKPFGEYYPHTRWVDIETHTIQVDAFPHYLLVTEQGKRPIKIRGFWKGRAFLKDSDPKSTLGYFGVAYEGDDAGFAVDPRLEKFHFKRIRPDPA